jgi:RES domain-containing protein
VRRDRIAPGEIAYRVLTPRWAWRPLSGAGAARNGGRFNRPGLETLYLATDPLTAIEEARQGLEVLTPVTLAAYLIGPVEVIDLTDVADPATLPDPWRDWSTPWKLIARVQGGTPPSWLCGDAALADRVPAIRYPSTRRAGGVALAVHTGLVPAGVLAVHDPNGDLPRDPSSWPRPVRFPDDVSTQGPLP